MKRLWRVKLLTATIVFVMYLFAVRSVYAGHPLITDDTGTQGKGKSQIEASTQWGFDKSTDDSTGINETAKTREGEVKIQYSYGIIETADLILGIPYQWIRTETDDVTTSDVNGIADISLEIKWRFYEKDGLSYAVKPGITIPTGDKDKDLGTGRTTGTFFFITTKEMEPWAFHINLGYKRNENKLDQREDIWHASIAGEWKVLRELKLVANIGAERNPEESSQTNPAFLLGGFIYSLHKNLDISAGIKGGLNEAETDYSFLGALTFRF